MSPDSTARRARGSKRRKIDSSEDTPVEPHESTQEQPVSLLAGIEQLARQEDPSPVATPVADVLPIVHPPEALSRPNALALWVFRDAEGKKKMTSEMIPGCRRWRIGDPNVQFCCECKKKGDVLGCRTCKKSYHAACLDDHTTGDPTSVKVFHCPTCIQRGWDVKPPSEILPLTPVSSRETSPATASLRNDPAVEITSQMDRMQSGRTGGPELHHFPVLTENEVAVQRAIVAVNHPSAIAADPQLGGSTTPTAGAETPGSWAAALTRTYDLQPPLTTSSGRQAASIEKPAGAARLGRPKSSRYSTMDDHVDQALAVIYRELERVTILRQDLAAQRDQVKVAEQARKMLEGHLALLRSSHPVNACKDAEIESLKGQLADLRTAHDSLIQENNLLKERMLEDGNSSKASLEEMQTLKATLRRLLGE